MSRKTFRKRIALVASASLGLALFVASPANALTQFGNLTASLATPGTVSGDIDTVITAPFKIASAGSVTETATAATLTLTNLSGPAVQTANATTSTADSFTITTAGTLGGGYATSPATTKVTVAAPTANTYTLTPYNGAGADATTTMATATTTAQVVGTLSFKIHTPGTYTYKLAVPAGGTDLTITVVAGAVTQTGTITGGTDGTTANAVGVVYSAGTELTATVNVATATTMSATGDKIGATVAVTGPSVTSPNATDQVITQTLTAAADTATLTSAVSGAVITGSWVSGSSTSAQALGTVKFTPTIPGRYTVTITPIEATIGGVLSASSTRSAVTQRFIVGSQSVVVPTVGTSISAKNVVGAQTGGQAVWQFIPSLVSATTTYFATVDTGSIVSAVSGGASGATGTITTSHSNTNGINTADGITLVSTLAGAFDSGAADLNATVVPSGWTIRVTSATAGAQTLTIKKLNATTGAVTTVATAVATYGAAPTASAQYSLITLYAGAVATAPTGAADDTEATTVSKTANVQRFNINFLLKDQYNATVTGLPLTASITGPGLIGLNATSDAYQTTLAATGRTLSAPAVGGVTGNKGTVSVWSDGTAGEATITISSGTTVLATKTVTFVGSPVKATATQYLKVAKAGTQLGATPSTVDGTNDLTTFALKPAFTVEVTDANGNDVAAGSTVKMVSSDSTKIVVGTCAENATYSGNFECSVSGAVGAASGASATVTFYVYNAATAAYDIATDALTFSVGGAIAKTTVTLDKTSYSPGEAMVLTVVSTDSAGNPAYDGQSVYAAISANKSLGGALPATTKYIVGGKYASSATSPSIFAPAVDGSFQVRGTTVATVAAPLGTAFVVEAAVENGVTTAASQAAADAAAEATDAANAATDAANAAAEAADAATAAAQDAADAVAALSVSVNAMVDSLKKQLVALTSLIVKIQKKLKA